MTVGLLINGLLAVGAVILVIILLSQVARFLKGGKARNIILKPSENSKELELVEKWLREDAEEKEETAAINRIEAVVAARKALREKS